MSLKMSSIFDRCLIEQSGRRNHNNGSNKLERGRQYLCSLIFQIWLIWTKEASYTFKLSCNWTMFDNKKKKKISEHCTILKFCCLWSLLQCKNTVNTVIALLENIGNARLPTRRMQNHLYNGTFMEQTQQSQLPYIPVMHKLKSEL